MSETRAVAFISSHAKLGGAERYLEDLLECLGPDWRRAVFALEVGPFAERVGATVVPTGAGAPSIARSAARLRRLLQAGRPDVVHANGVKAALVSVLATAGTGIPLVWVKHDFSFDGTLVRFVARRCKTVVAVSEALTETFGGPGGKVRVVHTGIGEIAADRAAGRARLLELLGVPAPTGIVALAGRLHPVKGHEELIAAAPAVLARCQGSRFVFLGGEDPSVPGFAEHLRRRVAELSLDGSVTFLGHRADAIDLLAGCDLGVIASVRVDARSGREGFPLVGLELLAVGTPIVAYADGGIPELVGDCGALVPPGDREALSAAVASALEQTSAREEMARRGRTRVAERFSRERWVEAMKSVYREAAA